MSKTVRNILVSIGLIVVGVISVIIPLYFNAAVFTRVISVSVGIAGILFSAAMSIVYKLFLGRRQAIALAVVSVIAGAAGVVLLIDGALYFLDPKYLVLADLVIMGGVTVAFALFLRRSDIDFWITVMIAGAGGITAGVFALLYVQVSLLVGCVTAAVILIYPLCVEAHKAKLDDNGRKIVVVREQDIEVIEDEEKK